MKFFLKWRVWMPLLCIVLTLFFIWSNSAKDAVTSSEQSDAVGAWLRRWFDVTQEPFRFIYENKRKLAHFAEFALLGLESGIFAGLNFKKQLYCVAGFLFCVLCAIIDEIIQLFSDGRVATVADVCIDAGGSLFGLLLVVLCTSLFRLFSKK